MDHISIQTPGGPLSFVGRIHTDRARPSLVTVRGSFPPKEHMLELPTQFSGVNVLVVTLPGMAGSFWASQPSVAGLTEGLQGAIAMLLPQAPMVVFGVSTGNLLALGLTDPNICRRVVVEPFFQTQDLWPFIANSRERLAKFPGHEGLPQFLWEFFGIASDRLENRDYRRLLDDITQPTDVMVGQLPLLPPRELEVWPSFTSAEDRASLAANPLVTLHEGPAGTGHGHGSVGPSYADAKALVHAALRTAAGLDD